MRVRHLIPFVACLALSPVAAQNDSLWSVWNDPAAPDSARLKAMQQLAWKAVFELPDSGMALAQLQLELAVKAGDAWARYEAHTTMAVGSSMKSDYATALDHLQQCLLTAREKEDLRREANTYSNMSNVYRSLGDLPLALEHLQRSLDLDTRSNNKEGLAGTLNNIGNIHTELGDLARALDHYERSAALYTELDQAKGRAQALMNLGATHLELGERSKALEEFLGSLNLYRTMGRKLEMGMAYNNLGRTFTRLGRPEEARASLDSANALFTTLGNPRQLARNRFYQGELWLEQGDPRKAIAVCQEGLSIARTNNLAQQRKECNSCLMRAYEEVGDLAKAFRAQKEYMQVSDSLEKLNNSREVTRLEVQRQFQQQQIADSLSNVRKQYQQELAYQTQLGRERNRRNLLLFGAAGILVLAGGLWNRLRFVRRSRAEIQREKERSEDLLHNILPEEVATELKVKGHADARQYDRVTVLFTDFKGFTQVSERLTPSELVDELNTCFMAFDAIVERHGIEKIKTIGDAYMAAAGLPDPNGPGAKEIVLAALDMQDFIRQRRSERLASGQPAFEMRVGLHTGPVVAGIVGRKKFAYDIWGDTVNVAARMESSGEPGRVNISADTHQLVHDVPAFQFTARGRIQAKGKGELDMYFVERA